MSTTKPTMRDGQAVRIACTLIATFPGRYVHPARYTPGKYEGDMQPKRLAGDVVAILAELPEWPEDPTENETKRVRPDWGDTPVGFVNS